MIYYGCPKCGTAMSSPDSMAGQAEKCPDCGNITVVPTKQPSAPPGPAATHVHIPTQKRTSGLGIASLVLGIVAVIGSWIPFVNFISIFLAAIGFIFGTIGFFNALISRRTSTNMPGSGVLVCIAALIISMFTTGLFVAAAG